MNELEALELIENNKPVDEIYLNYWVAKSEGLSVKIILDSTQEYQNGLWRLNKRGGYIGLWPIDWNFIGPLKTKYKISTFWMFKNGASICKARASYKFNSVDELADTFELYCISEIEAVKRAIIIKNYERLKK